MISLSLSSTAQQHLHSDGRGCAQTFSQVPRQIPSNSPPAAEPNHCPPSSSSLRYPCRNPSTNRQAACRPARACRTQTGRSSGTPGCRGRGPWKAVPSGTRWDGPLRSRDPRDVTEVCSHYDARGLVLGQAARLPREPRGSLAQHLSSA